jgi:hypothetical protein
MGERFVNVWKLITQMIDMRSFSSLWFWLGVAVYWSLSSHWVLGVPQDMIHRARRIGGAAVTDLECLVRINTQRVLFYAREAHVPLVGAIAFILTVLVLLGFFYGIELAQALLFFFVPAVLQGALAVFSAGRVEAGDGQGERLFRRLFLHRVTTQAMGMVAIFLTGLYGMYHNLISQMPG